jgi:hypothetical protein
MRLDKLNPYELADLGQRLLTLLNGGELSMIPANVRAAIVAAIGSKPTMLLAQQSDASELIKQLNAAFAIRNGTGTSLLGDVRQFRDVLKANLVSRAVFELCGLDYPWEPRSPYTAQDPTNLSIANIFSDAVRGRFRGNNRNGSVSYVVHRRVGMDGPWLSWITTSKQSFRDEDVEPGQRYHYKVRAVASSNTSNFSNEARIVLAAT